MVKVYEHDVSYRWIILGVIFGSQFVASMAAHGWGPLAPFLKKVMTLDNTEIGIISSSFHAAGTLSVFPAGVMIDRYGVRKGLLSWLGITGFPLLFLSFFHHHYSILLIMVALGGFGYAIGNPAGAKGLYVWFHKKTRGTVFGIRQSAVTGGGALSGILLVHIAQASGPFVALRTVCWMIMAMMVLTFLLYREPAGDEDSAVEKGSNDALPMIVGLRGVFSNMVLLKASMIAGILGLVQGAVVTFFLLFINERLGYSLLAAGSLFTMFMISGAAGRILWGVVSDRMFSGSRKPVLMLICGVGIVSVTLLALWVSTWPHWLFIPVVIGIGVSSWGWNGIYLVLVAELSDRTRTATSVGFGVTLSWFGFSLGPAWFGSMTDQFGYCYAWLSVAVFCTFAFLLCLLIPGSEGRAERKSRGRSSR